MTSGPGRPWSAAGAATAPRSCGRRARRQPAPAWWSGPPARQRCEQPSDGLPIPVGRADSLNVVTGGHEVAVLVDLDGQLRQGPGGRPEDRLGPLGHEELGLVA